MKIRRPRSLNGLLLVGFGFVAVPLLLAVIVISGVVSHAPARVRHFSIIHGRRLESL